MLSAVSSITLKGSYQALDTVGRLASWEHQTTFEIKGFELPLVIGVFSSHSICNLCHYCNLWKGVWVVEVTGGNCLGKCFLIWTAPVEPP